MLLAVSLTGPAPNCVAQTQGGLLPFDEFEAEDATTNGVVIGPDRHFTTIAAEASGRRAVRLAGVGARATFTLPHRADAFTVRYAVPDGTGMQAPETLGVYVGERRIGSFAVTARYGWYYGHYPFSNRPADGRGHHFFDHARLLLDRPLAAGTQVSLRVGREDRAPWYVIDLLDAEQTPPPILRPAHALSVVDFGADPLGRADAAPALRRAINAASARGVPVWLPPGVFRIDGHVLVDRVTLQGAGIWHTTLTGHGIGLYGQDAHGVTLRDFAIIGDVTERVDNLQVNAIGGAMSDTVISDLWLQHTKVGLWFDGPMHNIRVSRLRIMDMTADGLNFHRGVSDAVVEDSLIRNVGDDGLASWSDARENHGIVFRRNTVVSPMLANGIAVYGGRDITVTDNRVADTVTEGGGVHVGNRFHATPVAGTIRVERNLLLRAGSLDPNWRYGVGALWFYALDAPMTAGIRATGNRIVDPSEEAISFHGKPITGVEVSETSVEGARAPLVSLRSPGAATITDLNAAMLDSAGVRRCAPFTLKVERAPALARSTDQGCGVTAP